MIARANGGLLLRLNLVGSSPAAERMALVSDENLRREAVASAFASLMGRPKTEAPAIDFSLVNTAQAAAALGVVVAIPELIESKADTSLGIESEVELDDSDELLAALLEW